MQSIKEHNLKANHNLLLIYSSKHHSVCNLSKNTIWKQITTHRLGNLERCSLYAIYQRTQSESKSQPDAPDGTHALVCMQSIKEHNLKANHNSQQTLKQFLILYAIYQRTQSESKSQLNEGGQLTQWICMQSIKEHNLKANHNKLVNFEKEEKSVCNLSKNTIWKQITTRTSLHLHWRHLYAIYQRTQSESKSQLPRWRLTEQQICMQSIKEHNLKANHNNAGMKVKQLNSVCNLSKNTIWKQITTAVP